MEYDWLIGVSLICNFIFVYKLLKKKGVRINDNDIAPAILLGGFVAVIPILIMNRIFGEFIAIALGNVIAAFVFMKVLKS